VSEINELEEERGNENKKNLKNFKDEKFDAYDFLLNEIIDKICVGVNKEKLIEKKPILIQTSQKSNNQLNLIIDCVCNTYDDQKRLLIMCQLCEVR
jgi:hypothetical protein